MRARLGRCEGGHAASLAFKLNWLNHFEVRLGDHVLVELVPATLLGAGSVRFDGTDFRGDPVPSLVALRSLQPHRRW